MIRADDVPLLTIETTSLRGSVAPVLLLSAVCHVGAVAWGLSGTTNREIDAHAGSPIVMTVTIVAGPEAGSPALPSAPQESRAPAEAPTPKSKPVQPASETPETLQRTDRVRSADRQSDRKDNRGAVDAPDLPASTAAPPIPPPRPAIPETKNATGLERPIELARTDHGDPATTTESESASTSVPSTHDGLFGNMQGAAPHASNPAPSYPASARRRGQEGRVVLNVEVTVDGKPGKVMLETSSGHTALDRAALETVRRWRFRPAMKDGRPLTATVRIPIRFALN